MASIKVRRANAKDIRKGVLFAYVRGSVFDPAPKLLGDFGAGFASPTKAIGELAHQWLVVTHFPAGKMSPSLKLFARTVLGES